MTNNQKLKVLLGVFFVLIVVLIGMLIYAINIYNDKTDNSISSSASTAAVQSNVSSSTPSSAVTSTSSTTEESLELKLYLFDAMDYESPKEIRSITASKKLFEENPTAVINQLFETTGLNINKAVINGNQITVDLPKDIAAKFNMGSAGGITLTNTLAMTLVNLPGIEKLDVTVDGVTGVIGDHFSFNGVFAKGQEGKKYTFTDSGKDGTPLE